MKFTYGRRATLLLERWHLWVRYVGWSRKGLESRWVDVYETPGKRFQCSGRRVARARTLLLHPSQGGLDDVYTHIFEMGHSLHVFLVPQPGDYLDYSIFILGLHPATRRCSTLHGH